MINKSEQIYVIVFKLVIYLKYNDMLLFNLFTYFLDAETQPYDVYPSAAPRARVSLPEDSLP